jgi:DNA-binding IclR family transcriptional regulator
MKKKAKAAGAKRIPGSESSRKVLRLLLSFHSGRPSATVEELAKELGVPLSTGYRYVMLLREVGLLESRGTSVQLSPRVIDLARTAIAANGLIDLAYPIVQAMRDESGENVRLTRRMDESAVCIHQVECGKPVRLSFDVGQPRPLHRGAPAKVLLAFMPAQQQKHYLARLQEMMPDKACRQALLEELPLIRERGWAASEGEVDPGLWGAAAAVGNGREVIAAVSIAAPIYRIAKSKRPAILKIVRNGAAEISARLSPLHD